MHLDSVSQLELVCIKVARKQRNYGLCQRSLLRMMGGVPCNGYSGEMLSSCVQNYLALTASTGTFSLLSAKLLRETAKLLRNSGSVHDGSFFLFSVIHQLSPTLLLQLSSDATSLADPANESGQLAARSALKLATWLDTPDSEDLSLQPWAESLLKGTNGNFKF